MAISVHIKIIHKPKIKLWQEISVRLFGRHFSTDSYLLLPNSFAGAATTPDPSRNLTASPHSSSQINLNWATPQSNNDSPIIGYEIERAKGDLSVAGFSNSTNDVFFSGGNVTTFSDTGLAPATTYNYAIFARHSIGPSQPSNTADTATNDVTSVPLSCKWVSNGTNRTHTLRVESRSNLHGGVER